MCGRFVRSFTVEELIEELNEVVPTSSIVSRVTNDLWDQNFNVAPTTLIPVVYFENTQCVIDVMQWGFQPPKSSVGTSSIGPSLVINARSETMHEKQMFRSLLNSHRCIVPMDGFYEWNRDDTSRGKIPFYVSRHDGHRMWVAGLWRGQPRDTTTDHCAQVALLTADANHDIAHIHHRTPCQLTLEDAMHWASDEVAPLPLVEKHHHPKLHAWTVSKDVNSIRNNRPDLVDAVIDTVDNKQLGLFE